MVGMNLSLHHHLRSSSTHHHHPLLLLLSHLSLLLHHLGLLGHLALLLLLHHLTLRMHLALLLLYHLALLLHHLSWHLLVHDHLLLVWRSHGHPVHRSCWSHELTVGSSHHHTLYSGALRPYTLSHTGLWGALSVHDLAGRHVACRGHGGRGDVAAGPGGHCLDWGHVGHWRNGVPSHGVWTEGVVCMWGLAGMRRLSRVWGLAGMWGLSRVWGLA